MGYSRSRLAAAAAATLLLLTGFPSTSSFSFTPSSVTTHHALSRPKIRQVSWKRSSKLFMSDAAAATADDKDPPLFEAPLKGISRDYRMRLPLFKSDITDGINTQCLAAVLFLFFACLAPAVGFGALFGAATNGVSYVLVFAFCKPQIALIHISLFAGNRHDGDGFIHRTVRNDLRRDFWAADDNHWLNWASTCVCCRVVQAFGITRFALLAFVCMDWDLDFWNLVLKVSNDGCCYSSTDIRRNEHLMIVSTCYSSITSASNLVKYLTRFTDEIFSTLISFIFVVEAAQKIGKSFIDPASSFTKGLMTVIVAVTTYFTANTLRGLRNTVYFTKGIRKNLSNFGPTIGVVTGYVN
jgi:hypothetical protein